MEIPLQVAKDKIGIFRDALNRPMIMVFNSTKKHAKDSKKAGSKSDVNANHTESPLMFVQVNRSKKEARLERTKIRTHVMQNHFRQKQEKKTKPLQKRPHHIEHSQESVQASVVTSNGHIEICAFRLQPTASLDPFVSYPIEMDPRTHLLAHHYVTILVHWALPTGFGWAESFIAGLNDPALFHVVLLCTAVHLHFVNNHLLPTEVAYHKLKAIQSVNERLRDSPTAISDHTIHAVMLMALNEGVGGDVFAAKAHLNGLNRMIQIREGFPALDHALKQKICFTDYLCCVQPDEGPRFRFPAPSKSPCLNKNINLHKVPNGFQNILPLVPLDQEFLGIIVDVEGFCVRFGQAQLSDIRNRLGPHDYDVTTYRYRLICMENARLSKSHKELVGDACRVGTLAFFKTVFDQFSCWGPSHRVWGRPSKVLVDKLRAYLTRLDASTDAWQTGYLELSLWLSFLGGLMQLENNDRRWYNSHIATVAANLGLTCFDEVKEVLSRFLWIEWVHERPCRELWEVVQAQSERGKVVPLGSEIAAQSV